MQNERHQSTGFVLEARGRRIVVKLGYHQQIGGDVVETHGMGKDDFDKAAIVVLIFQAPSSNVSA